MVEYSSVNTLSKEEKKKLKRYNQKQAKKAATAWVPEEQYQAAHDPIIKRANLLTRIQKLQ